MEWLDILMQWLHLTAAVVGIGGMVYARMVLAPAMMELSPEVRSKLLASLVSRLRPVSFTVIGVLLVTGLYNLATHISGKPSLYHMLLGLKILLALHVFTMAFLLSVPPGANPARDARRPRLMAGAAISGVVILFLSAYLRRGF